MNDEDPLSIWGDRPSSPSSPLSPSRNTAPDPTSHFTDDLTVNSKQYHSIPLRPEIPTKTIQIDEEEEEDDDDEYKYGGIADDEFLLQDEPPLIHGTEESFLETLLLSLPTTETQDPLQLKTLLKSRIAYLRRTDDVLRLTRLPYWKIAVLRFPAILVTICLELVVGWVIARNGGLLEKHIVLASFMPILSSIAGNIGLQSSTNTLRYLATRQIGTKNSWPMIKKELFVAGCIAAMAGGFLFVIASVWAKQIMMGVLTASSILCTAVLAGFVGSVGPLIVKYLGGDPGMTIGPAETALQDLLGISTYFTLAGVFLGNV